MAKKISSLAVSIVADVKKYQKGMKKAREETSKTSKNLEKSKFGTKAMFQLALIQKGVEMVVSGLQTAISFLIRFGIRASEVFFETARALDETIKRARELGLTTSELQQWQFAADLLGVKTTTVTRAMKQANRRIGEALLGYGELAVNAKNAAISMELFRNKTTQQRFTILINQLSEMKDVATQAAVAYKFGGRSLTDLLNIINSGRKNLDGIIADFKRLSVGADDFADTAGVNVENFLDNFRRLKLVVQSVARIMTITISGPLSKALEDIIRNSLRVVDAFKRAFDVSVSQDLIKYVNLLVEGLDKLGTVIAQGLIEMAPDIKNLVTDIVKMMHVWTSSEGLNGAELFIKALKGMVYFTSILVRDMTRISELAAKLTGRDINTKQAEGTFNFGAAKDMRNMTPSAPDFSPPQIASLIQQGTAEAFKLQAKAQMGMNDLKEPAEKTNELLEELIKLENAQLTEMQEKSAEALTIRGQVQNQGAR